MEIKLSTLAGTIVAVAVLSVAATKYYFPNIESKTEFVEKEVVKTDIVTVTKEVVRPDGTKEVITTTTDKSVSKSDTRNTELKMDVKSNLLVTAGVLSNFKDKPEYMLGVSKRVLGPAFVGATYQTNNTYGLTVTVEF